MMNFWWAIKTFIGKTKKITESEFAPYWLSDLRYFVENLLTYDWRFARNWLIDKITGNM